MLGGENCPGSHNIDGSLRGFPQNQRAYSVNIGLFVENKQKRRSFDMCRGALMNLYEVFDDKKIILMKKNIFDEKEYFR